VKYFSGIPSVRKISDLWPHCAARTAEGASETGATFEFGKGIPLQVPLNSRSSALWHIPVAEKGLKRPLS